MRSQWVETDKVRIILALMTRENALACEVSLRYGMRIGDVLSITRSQAAKRMFSYREQKTGKMRSVTLSPRMQVELLRNSGEIYVFEHRLDPTRHRTRQAVYKDVRRVAELIRKKHVTPHSMRKVYAVEAYERYRSLERVKKLLNHSDEAVTMIYALADKM